jgi:putative SOS response-associated peptidase YedK
MQANLYHLLVWPERAVGGSTTTPNSLVSTINHERMPVLLTREEEFKAWLHGSLDEALARQYPAEEMRIVQEGFA